MSAAVTEGPRSHSWREGYDIYGVDLSKDFIAALRRGLPSNVNKLRFRTADMRFLPFRDDTFDVVLCLWSTFDELLFRKDQVRAVKEMRRVLKNSGFAFIECHTYMAPDAVVISNGDVRGYQKRILRLDVAGMDYFHYNHDEESLRRVLAQAGIRKYSVGEEWFGWRERMITRFSK